jgi:alpha-mannosidase
MSIEELIVLLPCHSLEDFPSHHEGEEADGLLAAWSGLWHPALMAAVNAVPQWFRADAPPENPSNRLIVIPKVSDDLLLSGWPTKAKADGAKLIRKPKSRADLVTAALALFDPPLAPVAPDLVADFHALGSAYLWVELLTRQMRYMSNLDEIRFNTEAVAAAQAAVAGNEDDARQRLTNAFETLYEARERFYPVDNFLVDITLTAETTLGPSLRKELAGETPLNLLLTGKVLERLAATAPESFAALQNALDRHTVGLVGGEYDEREAPLQPAESVLRQFTLGRAAFQKHLGRVPDVYARRRQGLTPLLPQILSKFGYEGALGFTLDDGAFPTPDQCKTRWEGLDENAVDLLGRVPLDASRGDSFLDLARKLGESMDRDMVATTTFAHWPGAASPYYDDLRRIATYRPILGKFITLSDYFQHTERPSQVTRFSPDRYRTNFLRQAIVRNLPNPITWVADAQKRLLRAEAAATLQTMIESVRCKRTAFDSAAVIAAADATASLDAAPTTLAAADAEIDLVLQTAAKQTAALLQSTTASAGAETGLLLLNPLNTSRRELVDLSALDGLPAVGGSVLAVQQNGAKKSAIVTVPGCGFTWLKAAPQPPAPRKPPKNIVDGEYLRTDLLEVHVSPKSGGIQGVFGYNLRGNRLSQQLAFRLPAERPKPGDLWRDPDLDPPYSAMVCDALEPSLVGPAIGEITTRGRLIDPANPDRALARYVQRVRAAKGLPLVTVEVDLEVDEAPRAESWGSYYAARFAWADAATELARGVYLTHQPTTAKRPESPSYLEFTSYEARTLILPDGLPYTVQTGMRMLDLLLVGKGETRRSFRFGIVVDPTHPAQDALNFMLPPLAVPQAAKPASGETGRLFLIDAKNVVATHWESIYDEADAGRVVGFRVRLLETEGRAGRVELHAPRKISTARQIDHRGQTILDVPAGDDRIDFDLAAFEWIELEAKY